MHPGRNDPCPCGSGKKYKRCCAPRDDAARLQDAATDASPPPPMPVISSPDTWRSWGVSHGAAAAFFHAAAAFYRARPWQVLTDHQWLHAELPSGRTWTVGVLGNAGEEFGLALYADPEDAVRQAAAATPEEAAGALRGLLLSFTFEVRANLPPPMQREIATAGWEVAAHAAYPLLLVVNHPGEPAGGAWIEDLTALLQAIPRFVQEHRALLERDMPVVTPVEWYDDQTEVWLWYSGEVLLEPAPLWPAPDILAPALPAGPNADPAAAIELRDEDELAAHDFAIVHRFRDHLLAQRELGPLLADAQTENAAIFCAYLAVLRVPLAACSEYDLRVFLYDWYPGEVRPERAAALAMLDALDRFFAYTAAHEGLVFPWAAPIVHDRAVLEERVGVATDEEPDEAFVLGWLDDLYADLEARVLTPDAVDDDEPATSEIGPLQAALRHERQRRWLLWRDELIAAGTTAPKAVEAALTPRVRAWRRTPHPRYGGRAPLDVIRQEQADLGFS